MSSDTEKPVNQSRRNFLKIGAGVVGAAAVASVIEAPLSRYIGTAAGQTGSSTSSTSSGSGSTTSSGTTSSTSLVTSVGSTTSTASASTTISNTPQNQVAENRAFFILNPAEVAIVAAVAETFIPTGPDGPGANEAGAVYFVDNALKGEYGTNGNMYMQGPFITPGTKGPLTVDGITYSGGSPAVRLGAGTRWQYPLRMRQWWKIGLEALDSYATSAYGGAFASLSASNRVAALTDLWNNKPTNFSISIPGFTNGASVTETLEIIPQDFFYDLWMLCWSGFLMDPAYGGNQNMVGWIYTGFNGTNQGDFYGEGLTTRQLMVATSPTLLQPATLGQFQQAGGDTGTTSNTNTSSTSSGSVFTGSASSSSGSGSSSSTSSPSSSGSSSTSGSPSASSGSSTTTAGSSSNSNANPAG